MNKILTEVAVYSAEAAVSAQEAGANRVELCSDMSAGGVTPSMGAIETARNKLTIPLHVIIRPRGGDFLYNETEFLEMKSDILTCKKIGVNGVVFGILNPNGSVDTKRSKELVQLAAPLSCTFHRAFDMTAMPMEALADVIACGFHRILSSGCKPSAMEGAELLADLVKQAQNRIIIMPGGGVRKENIQKLIMATGAHEFHTSAAMLKPGGMLFRNNRVSMGKAAQPREYSHYALDSEELKLFIQTINQLHL